MIKRLLVAASCIPLLLGMAGGIAGAQEMSSSNWTSYMSSYSEMYNSSGGTSGSSSNSSSTNSNIYINNNNTQSTSSTPTTTQPSKQYTQTDITSSLSNSGVYAALGDSIPAGLGLAPPSSPTAADTRCGISSQGYPNIVAQQTGLRLINTSCSGAMAGDLISTQLDAAFSNGRPELITITAGANDVRWVSFLRACSSTSTNCANRTADAVSGALIATTKSKLASVLQAISDRSAGSPPTVIVTGYYNPISNYCKGRQNYVTNQEINFLNAKRDALNKAIREVVAQYPFARYASTNFTNHAVCAQDPWIQGLNDSAPLHPTAQGQQHIAESVIAAMP